MSIVAITQTFKRFVSGNPHKEQSQIMPRSEDLRDECFAKLTPVDRIRGYFLRTQVRELLQPSASSYSQEVKSAIASLADAVKKEAEKLTSLDGPLEPDQICARPTLFHHVGKFHTEKRGLCLVVKSDGSIAVHFGRPTHEVIKDPNTQTPIFGTRITDERIPLEVAAAWCKQGLTLPDLRASLIGAAKVLEEQVQAGAYEKARSTQGMTEDERLEHSRFVSGLNERMNQLNLYSADVKANLNVRAQQADLKRTLYAVMNQMIPKDEGAFDSATRSEILNALGRVGEQMYDKILTDRLDQNSES